MMHSKHLTRGADDPDFAPVVLFAFNRPAHTKQTLDALAENSLAARTRLIVYCDGPRDQRDSSAIAAVCEIVREARGFLSVELRVSPQNKGLAGSIIEGVSNVCEEYGRVIVMEDDLVTSREFLSFMNKALDRYETEPGVWHISGWNYPIPDDGLGDAFFLRVMNCWGWATWQDRWHHYRKDTDALINTFTPSDIKRFSLNGAGDFWKQVQLNESGQINTWAIYWYATIFKNNGLCLNPAVSYVLNIGHDGSGTHGSKSKGTYDSRLCEKPEVILPNSIIESTMAIQRIATFLNGLKPTFIQRLRGKIVRTLKGMIVL
ncbi:hypothetical protein V3390_00720 [Luteimonas sp. FXH3W]|uniref:Sugar transferase n=1 Tax=Aquilutibacter rugosus TaxID=3115820 RepID=A0ABU7UX16_9GAMM